MKRGEKSEQPKKDHQPSKPKASSAFIKDYSQESEEQEQTSNSFSSTNENKVVPFNSISMHTSEKVTTEEPQLQPEPEKLDDKTLAFSFTLNNQSADTLKLPNHVVNNTKSQIQTVLSSPSSKQLFEMAEQQRREEEKREREKNRKLVEAILARKQEGANYLAISAKKLKSELREDFRSFLVGLDEEIIDRIIRKGRFSIEIELAKCGNKGCLQGCNDEVPSPSHLKLRLRISNQGKKYFPLPENFSFNQYIEAKST